MTKHDAPLMHQNLFTRTHAKVVSTIENFVIYLYIQRKEVRCPRLADKSQRIIALQLKNVPSNASAT